MRLIRSLRLRPVLATFMCFFNAPMCMHSIFNNIQSFDSTPRRYSHQDQVQMMMMVIMMIATCEVTKR